MTADRKPSTRRPTRDFVVVSTRCRPTIDQATDVMFGNSPRDRTGPWMTLTFDECDRLGGDGWVPQLGDVLRVELPRVVKIVKPTVRRKS